MRPASMGTISSRRSSVLTLALAISGITRTQSARSTRTRHLIEGMTRLYDDEAAATRSTKHRHLWQRRQRTREVLPHDT